MTLVPPPSAPPATLLALNAVSRHFGGVRAVDGVTFAVARGTVHGLIGPNGAGKTTVLNLVSGLMPVTAGAIELSGSRLDRLGAEQIAGLGVRRTFQNIRLFPLMTARDNVIAGRHAVRAPGRLRRMANPLASVREEAEQRARAEGLLERVGLAGRAEQQARNLAYGEQRRLEIARALAGEPHLLLLDEPAAGMPYAEMTDLRGLIRSIAADGCTVLLIEHNMDLVMNVCDQITVLDFGRVIAEGTPAQVRADPAVITAYLGAE